jgi:hypothetical protein
MHTEGSTRKTYEFESFAHLEIGIKKYKAPTKREMTRFVCIN